ncbi:MAG: hypothetical protein MJ052_06120 [Sphaerochaetaceae bacterium]|nr:hypothetical protein [Sphaerochaetaceae bacterium]
MIPYTTVETSKALISLVADLTKNGIESVAMDFEEESNLHVYGEHLCLIQLFDGSAYYIVDAWKIQNYPDGVDALRFLLESPMEKIMFDCSSDASIVRKTMKIQLRNIFDLRVIAQALGFNGNLTGLIERNLHFQTENPALKKKYQRANWMKRPLSEEQIHYALDDVKYLFDLKLSLLEEMKTLPGNRKRLHQPCTVVQSRNTAINPVGKRFVITELFQESRRFISAIFSLPVIILQKNKTSLRPMFLRNN